MADRQRQHRRSSILKRQDTCLISEATIGIEGCQTPNMKRRVSFAPTTTVRTFANIPWNMTASEDSSSSSLNPNITDSVSPDINDSVSPNITGSVSPEDDVFEPEQLLLASLNTSQKSSNPSVLDFSHDDLEEHQKYPNKPNQTIMFNDVDCEMEITSNVSNLSSSWFADNSLLDSNPQQSYNRLNNVSHSSEKGIFPWKQDADNEEKTHIFTSPDDDHSMKLTQNVGLVHSLSQRFFKSSTESIHRENLSVADLDVEDNSDDMEMTCQVDNVPKRRSVLSELTNHDHQVSFENKPISEVHIPCYSSASSHRSIQSYSLQYDNEVEDGDPEISFNRRHSHVGPNLQNTVDMQITTCANTSQANKQGESRALNNTLDASISFSRKEMSGESTRYIGDMELTSALNVNKFHTQNASIDRGNKSQDQEVMKTSIHFSNTEVEGGLAQNTRCGEDMQITSCVKTSQVRKHIESRILNNTLDASVHFSRKEMSGESTRYFGDMEFTSGANANVNEKSIIRATKSQDQEMIKMSIHLPNTEVTGGLPQSTEYEGDLEFTSNVNTSQAQKQNESRVLSNVLEASICFSREEMSGESTRFVGDMELTSCAKAHTIDRQTKSFDRGNKSRDQDLMKTSVHFSRTEVKEGLNQNTEYVGDMKFTSCVNTSKIDKSIDRGRGNESQNREMMKTSIHLPSTEMKGLTENTQYVGDMEFTSCVNTSKIDKSIDRGRGNESQNREMMKTSIHLPSTEMKEGLTENTQYAGDMEFTSCVNANRIDKSIDRGNALQDQGKMKTSIHLSSTDVKEGLTQYVGDMEFTSCVNANKIDKSIDRGRGNESQNREMMKTSIHLPSSEVECELTQNTHYVGDMEFTSCVNANRIDKSIDRGRGNESQDQEKMKTSFHVPSTEVKEGLTQYVGDMEFTSCVNANRIDKSIDRGNESQNQEKMKTSFHVPSTEVKEGLTQYVGDMEFTSCVNANKIDKSIDRGRGNESQNREMMKTSIHLPSTEMKEGLTENTQYAGDMEFTSCLNANTNDKQGESVHRFNESRDQEKMKTSIHLPSTEMKDELTKRTHHVGDMEFTSSVNANNVDKSIDSGNESQDREMMKASSVHLPRTDMKGGLNQSSQCIREMEFTSCANANNVDKSIDRGNESRNRELMMSVHLPGTVMKGGLTQNSQYVGDMEFTSGNNRSRVNRDNEHSIEISTRDAKVGSAQDTQHKEDLGLTLGIGMDKSYKEDRNGDNYNAMETSLNLFQDLEFHATETNEDCNGSLSLHDSISLSEIAGLSQRGSTKEISHLRKSFATEMSTSRNIVKLATPSKYLNETKGCLNTAAQPLQIGETLSSQKDYAELTNILDDGDMLDDKSCPVLIDDVFDNIPINASIKSKDEQLAFSYKHTIMEDKTKHASAQDIETEINPQAPVPINCIDDKLDISLFEKPELSSLDVYCLLLREECSRQKESAEETMRRLSQCPSRTNKTAGVGLQGSNAEHKNVERDVNEIMSDIERIANISAEVDKFLEDWNTSRNAKSEIHQLTNRLEDSKRENAKLRSNTDELDKRIEERIKAEKNSRHRLKELKYHRLQDKISFMACLSEWSLLKDDNDSLTFGFLANTILLNVKLMSGQFPHQKIANISLESKLSDNCCPWAKISHALMFSSIDRNALVLKYTDGSQLYPLLEDLSELACVSRELCSELKIIHLKHELSVDNLKVRMRLWSHKHLQKIEVSTTLRPGSYPIKPLQWEVNVLMSPLSSMSVLEVLNKVTTGAKYITRCVDAVCALMSSHSENTE